MTTKKPSLISISFLLAIIGCNNISQQNAKQVDTTSIEKVSKTNTSFSGEDTLPNDKFKKEIIAKITNQEDMKMFDTLLTQLDKKGLSYCQFVQRLFQLDDSCNAVAKQKFPDPSQQNDFSKIHSKAIKEAETKYLKSLNLRKDFSTFASIAYSLDPTIKNFCGTY